jgi:membrane protein
VWGLATVAFTTYVSTVGTYDRIYGWLGGALALLLWLYITNLVLVLGAEVDAELVRVRQLRAGIRAEQVVQLPMRDTNRNLLLARQRARDETEGRAIREKSTPLNRD